MPWREIKGFPLESGTNHETLRNSRLDQLRESQLKETERQGGILYHSPATRARSVGLSRWRSLRSGSPFIQSAKERRATPDRPRGLLIKRPNGVTAEKEKEDDRDRAELLSWVVTA